MKVRKGYERLSKEKLEEMNKPKERKIFEAMQRAVSLGSGLAKKNTAALDDKLETAMDKIEDFVR